MSQSVLTHSLRHLPPWLIFDVRQIQTSARIAQMIFERLGTALDHRPTASGYGPHATPIPVYFGCRARNQKRFRFSPGRRSANKIDPARMTSLRIQKIKPTAPNNAMERSQILVTNRAGARFAPSIRLAHLDR